MIVFKDVLGMLSKKGWSAYRLIKSKQFGNSTITRLRNGESITTDTIDKICELCDCQPGDLMSYVPGKQEE